MPQENIEGLIKGLGGTRSIIKKLDRSIIKKLFDTRGQMIWSKKMQAEKMQAEIASRDHDSITTHRKCKPIFLNNHFTDYIYGLRSLMVLSTVEKFQ
jgi:hypothetical protein